MTPQNTSRKVGGYMNDDKWTQEFEALRDLVKNEVGNESDIVENEYYTNGYDSPWKFYYRRNEVWIVKAGN